MARNQRFSRIACVVLVAGACAAGCSKPTGAPPGNAQIQPTYNAKTGRLERIAYDRNRDGKVDAWTVMNGTRVVRAELDENGDGRVDRWEFYDTGDKTESAPAGGAPATGVLVKVESATRNDGKVSRWEFYEKGQRVRAEEDTDADGRVDKWETWGDGALTMVLLDTDADGKADRRIVYPPDGSSPRFEIAGADGTFAAAP